MAVVQSEGTLASVHSAPMPIRTGVDLYEGTFADYQAIYRTQPNVRTVVDFLARNIAQLGLKVYRRLDDDNRQHLTGHPLSRTIRKPNPWTTRFRLIDTLVHDIGIHGRGYWIKLASNDGGIHLLRMPPWLMKPDGGGLLGATGYKILGNRSQPVLPADAVVAFRLYDPQDERVGLSPLETLRRILAEEAAAGAYREEFWQNRARMETVVKRPTDAPKWSDSARKRFREEFEALYSGQAASGVTAVLEEGMDLERVASTMQEAQYLEVRKLTREECASAYHVLPSQVGIMEHANFANMTEQHRQLYQDTLPPWVVMLQEDIDLQLLPAYDDVDDVYTEFNLDEKLRGSFEEQSKAAQAAVGAPWMTRNEQRAKHNMPPAPGGDELVVPLNVLVGGQASPVDATPDSRSRGAKTLTAQAVRSGQVAKHREVLAGAFARQRQAVMSALGGANLGTLDDVWDQPRWNSELRDDLLALALTAAAAFGGPVAETFGGEYDPAERSGEWLMANARIAAENINSHTRVQLGDALGQPDTLDEVRDVFDTAAETRAPALAEDRVTTVGNFAQVEAAAAAGASRKTWRVTSSNPRPSHAVMDGETVAIGARFSNGAKWPGDPVLDVDDIAGCSCDVEFQGGPA